MAGYIGANASVVTPGAERKRTFSIASTTTNLTGLSYTPGFVHVFHNGIRLVDGTDYTATTGTSITLTTAAENGDEVVVISYGSFQVADAYTKAEADGRYVNAIGDTMTGALALPSGGLNVGSGQLAVDASGRVTMPNQPAFSATLTAGDVASGVVLWNVVQTNIGGHYNSSTGRFTAPVAGAYFFSAQGIFGNSSSLSNGLMRIRKNGNVLHNSHYNMSDAWENCSIHSVIDLTVNDYVDVDIFGTTNGSYLYGQAEYSSFCGHLIG